MRRFRLGILAFFALGLTPRVASPGDPAPRRIEARVDPRIELMSTVFRLAGSPEYSRGAVPAYEPFQLPQVFW